MNVFVAAFNARFTTRRRQDAQLVGPLHYSGGYSGG